jgi:hypothetical protein
MIYRVCVCGGRDYNDKEKVFKYLDYIAYNYLVSINKEMVLINGGARGADNLSTLWAKARNISLEVFKADWDKYPRSAGPIRNREMLSAGIDLLISFPGGKGTADMVNICKKAKVKTVVL